ncbi:MAG: MMPL family transporter, partial [Myxococcota bacterium]
GVFTLGMGYFASKIQVRGDFAALLPEHYASVRGFERMVELTGGQGFLILAVQHRDPGLVAEMIERLSQKIAKRRDLLRGVRIHKVDPFVQKRALFFLKPSDLSLLHKRLLKLHRDVKREALARNPFALNLEESSKGTSRPATTLSTTSKPSSKPHLHVGDLLRKYGIPRDLLSRKSLITNDSGTLGVILAQPVKDENHIAFTRMMHTALLGLERELKRAVPRLSEVRVRYSGRYMVRLEEDDALHLQIGLASGVSLIVVLLLLLLYTRQKRSILLIGLPLMMGVVWTAGATYFLAGGEINMITAFILAVLFGLGIDMGIHFFMHFLRQSRRGERVDAALVATLWNTGRSGGIAVCTTAGSFFVMKLTEFKGLSQFGWVAGMGLLWVFVAFVTVFPALALWLDQRSTIRERVPRSSPALDAVVEKNHFRWYVTGFALSVCVFVWGGVCFWRGDVRFDDDVWHLLIQGNAVKTYNVLKSDVFKGEAEPGAMLFGSWENLRKAQGLIEAQLRQGKFSAIRTVYSQLSLVPEHQEDKAVWLKKIQRVVSRKAFHHLETEHPGAYRRLLRLRKMSGQRPYGLSALPRGIRRALGEHRPLLFIVSKVNPMQAKNAIAYTRDLTALKAFVVKSGFGEGLVLGDSNMVLADMFRLLWEDSPRAVGYAFLVILMTLLLGFWGRWVSILLVLLPLCAGFSLLMGVMAILDLRINAYNVLALPVMLGLGIDHNVYIYRHWERNRYGSVLKSLEGVLGAIVLAALTSIVGFGSLCLLQHPGLRQFWMLATFGIVCG